jgi:transposase-like protein
MSSIQNERRELWRQRLAQQEQSGRSVRAFCQSESIAEHAFYYWRQRLREKKKPVRFALLQTKPSSESTPSSIELVLAGGDRLHIPNDAATLRMVLSILREGKAA